MSNTNAMVAHLWAQGERKSARSGNGNFSFEGASLYSYATEVARLVCSPITNERVALITTDRYSVTTSGKHMPAARQAVRHLPSFHVPLFTFVDHATELAHLVDEYRNEVKRLTRARYWGGYRAAGLLSLAGAARDFARLFGLTVPEIDVDADIGTIFAAHAKRGTPKAVAKRERDRERRKAAMLRANAEKIERWHNGERVSLPDGVGVLLRVNGDILQTSLGARVPLADAIRVFRFAAAVRAKGEDWRPNGLRGPAIGDFTLTAIRSDGTIVAGCHTIEWAESERLARELGVEA